MDGILGQFSMHFRLRIVSLEIVIKNLGAQDTPKQYEVKWIGMNALTNLIKAQSPGENAAAGSSLFQ